MFCLEGFQTCFKAGDEAAGGGFFAPVRSVGVGGKTDARQNDDQSHSAEQLYKSEIFLCLFHSMLP